MADTTFNFLKNRGKSKSQNFDKEEIHIIKAGKKINMYNWIQENREDTEIYPTLEKYGCIDRLIVNEEEIYGDLDAALNLRTAMERIKAGTEVWNRMPYDVRKEFNNSASEFIERGMDWAKDIIDKKKADFENSALGKEIAMNKRNAEKLKQEQLKPTGDLNNE